MRHFVDVGIIFYGKFFIPLKKKECPKKCTISKFSFLIISVSIYWVFLLMSTPQNIPVIMGVNTMIFMQ